MIKRKRELKKHSRTSPDVQFKEFSSTEQKINQKRTMSELVKPVAKQSDLKNILKKLKINVKTPHMNKKTTSEKEKFGSNKTLGLNSTMNGIKPF